MNTQNCLSCNKVYEGMKGKLMIVVNKPRNFNVPAPVQISDSAGNIDVIIATGSVYIIDVIEETSIHAMFGCNFDSVSNNVTVSPNEFNYIEIDYEYHMHNNYCRVSRAVLKKTENI